jgi:immune inhibitor A
LVAAGIAAVPGLAGPADPVPDLTQARFQPNGDDYYINYVESRDERSAAARETPASQQAKASKSPSAKEYAGKFTEGNPVAGRTLAKIEKEAARTKTNPRKIRYKTAEKTQTAKLLTILVEFNPAANDDFTNVYVPQQVQDDPLTPDLDERSCVKGTRQNGPLHNNIPNPANGTKPDNNSMWVPDFSSAHFNQMLYSADGITKRVRTDLRGPDGKPGIDLRGYSMRNMYLEMSKGAYTVTGQASPWITVPHSEGWYGADTCQLVDGTWIAGAPQDDDGHPDNAGGVSQLGIDAVTALAASNPDFPWADYDVEDVSDADGDGNLAEPDGVIDHLVLVHAGEDASGGGGEQGVYATWAHSSAIVPGFTVPGTNIAISNYILQPEDSGVGVFAHEYGHDLGLPDLYDTGSGGDSDVDFWDLMGSGSHAGPIFQGTPTHMGLWDKFVLGWADPEIVNPGEKSRTLTVGQSSRTPQGTADGVRINLPTKTLKLSQPHSGSMQWWSGRDQSWADVRITRQLAVPSGTDVRFWMWNNYTIEADWDYGFVEVSTDDGTTWTELKVRDESGAVVSTDDGYADPNNRLRDYGNKRYGLTGSTSGYQHHQVDLTPYSGKTISLRLRYATDAGFEETGWFSDDFAVTSAGTPVWSDDVESGDNGWQPLATTFTNTSGTGWTRSSGSFDQEQYYLAEWRNLDGFDQGLSYGYTSNYSRDGAWKVNRVPYNAPGMLVWYRDTTYVSVNHTLTNLAAGPSAGAKGSLLLVDSHFDPLRRTATAAAKDPTLLKNLASRAQSSNVAFGFGATTPFRECFEAAGEPFSAYCTNLPALPGVSTFDDSRGWYPGLEYRPDLNATDPLFFRDADASTVIPSRDNQAYPTRIVDKNGRPMRSMYGQQLPDLGTVLGDGNPGAKNLGVKISLVSPGSGNQWVTVKVTPARAG